MRPCQHQGSHLTRRHSFHVSLDDRDSTVQIAMTHLSTVARLGHGIHDLPKRGDVDAVALDDTAALRLLEALAVHIAPKHLHTGDDLAGQQ